MQTTEKTQFFTDKTFRRTGILACSSVFLLFLLGGFVRVTGSGMGCPDWPKCFGLLAPPTCPCQLPSNYQQLFLEKRVQKVERFAKLLDKMGMTSKALSLRADKSILVPEEFNAFKAWTEYINRIFGVLAGFFSLFFFLISLRYIRSSRKTTLFALFGFIMLLFNAWLGSIVVATNLFPGIVSLHFMLSFSCLFLFLLALHSNKPFVYDKNEVIQKSVWILFFSLVFIEVFLGTLARETADALKLAGNQIDQSMLNFKAMGQGFAIHRFLPGLVFILSIWFVRKFRIQGNTKEAKAMAMVAILVFLQISFGAFNIVFVLPAWSQVLHILVGSFLPMYLFYFVLVENPKLSLKSPVIQ